MQNFYVLTFIHSFYGYYHFNKDWDFFVFLMGVLLYNVVSAAAIQKHEAGISTHMSSPSQTSHSPPTPSHPSRLSQSTVLSPLSNQQLPTICFTYGNVFVSVLLSIPPALSFPHCVHLCVLYVCVSIFALQIGSSVPFF